MRLPIPLLVPTAGLGVAITLACGGAPAPRPAAPPASVASTPPAEPDPTDIPDVHAPVCFGFPRDTASRRLYWRSCGPRDDRWGTPVHLSEEDGWTRLAYNDVDADALMAAWLSARKGEPVWRSDDGREVWSSYMGTEALRVSVEGDQAVTRARRWLHTTPAEMPSHPFCVGEELRPWFRFGDDGQPVLRACRTVGTTSGTGPWELAAGDTVLRGTQMGGHFHGPFAVSRATDDGTEVLASGEYDEGEPTGEWRFGEKTTMWRGGQPDPPTLNGVISMPRGARGDYVENAEITVLDVNLASGSVAWRIRHALNFDRHDSGARDCSYPGLHAGEGVVLGLQDLRSGEEETWTVYAAVDEEEPCTTEGEATKRLDAAKAAFVAHGLDVTRFPEVITFTDGQVDLGGGHTLSVTEIEPPVADAYSGPWLLTEAPFIDEDFPGYNRVFHDIRLDGDTVFQTYRLQPSACAGSETFFWEGVWRQGNHVVASYIASRYDCTGSIAWRGFSPIFTLTDDTLTDEPGTQTIAPAAP